jgi:amidase
MPQSNTTLAAAPIGRSRERLPIGARFIGPFLEDLTTIAFAGQVATALGITAADMRDQVQFGEFT